MKVQDIVFVLAFLFILYKRNPNLAVAGGIFCLVLSIPLFSLWIFFTAEHLTWYAGAFFLVAIILQTRHKYL